MNITKKAMILVLSVVIFSACDNGLKEAVEKHKTEVTELKKMIEKQESFAEEAAAKAVKFEEKYKEANSRSVKSQIIAEKLAGKLEACQNGK